MLGRLTALRHVAVPRFARSLATFQVKVPPMGEAVTQGDLVEWLKKPGDKVAVDEVICVLETDKVTVDIRSQEAGILTKQLASVDDTVHTDQAVAEIDTDGEVSGAQEGSKGEESPTQEAAASPASGIDDLHLPPPRMPLIHFRHGKRDESPQVQQTLSSTPASPIPSLSSSATSATLQDNRRHSIPVPPGPGARTEFVDLPAAFGRLPPLSETEMLRVELGGADP